MIALGFTGLGARAAYIQIFNNDFFQRQGVVRFARTIELPANRGRVLDRKGNPVRGAALELWQCNAAGRYDHPGDIAT
eukprot:gene49154-65882_t